jgi:hypothetical protein
MTWTEVSKEHTMKIWERMTARIFAKSIQAGVRSALALSEDDPFFSGARANLSERDRWDGEREDVLRQALEAWRFNPIARRLVGLTTQFVVGSGFTITCKHEATNEFIKAWMQHPLNRVNIRIAEMCDELTRSGNLFVLFSTDASGFSYIRCVPALDIDRIIVAGE